MAKVNFLNELANTPTKVYFSDLWDDKKLIPTCELCVQITNIGTPKVIENNARKNYLYLVFDAKILKKAEILTSDIDKSLEKGQKISLHVSKESFMDAFCDGKNNLKVQKMKKPFVNMTLIRKTRKRLIIENVDVLEFENDGNMIIDIG